MMIRPMTERDIPAVARLEAGLFGPGAWNENMLAEEFHGPARHYLVCEAASASPPNVACTQSSAGPAPGAALDVTDAYSTPPAADAPGARHLPCAMNVADTQSGQHTTDVADTHSAPCASDAPGAQVVGYAGYWWDGDDAELMTIGVASPWQRRGIAGALLDRLIADATAQGARRMLLEVRVDNDPALALYRGRGFYRIGLRRRYYQPENKDAYTMALDLKARPVGFAPPAA